MQTQLFKNTPNLNVIEGSVDDVLLDENNKCTGVLLGTVYIYILFMYLKKL